MKTLTWTGRPATIHKSEFKDIIEHIPTFETRDFQINGEGESNEYLNMIVNTNHPEMPITTVSKSYSLIQHLDVLEAVDTALGNLNYAPGSLDSDVTITEYGERMWVKIRFPEEHSFDPGDGHKLDLQMHALNSVDKSMRLVFRIGWFRIICENGLMQMHNVTTTSKKHTASLGDLSLKEYFSTNIEEVAKEQDQYHIWHKQTIKPGDGVLEHWIDSTVTNRWGVPNAARAYHIMETGYDGKPDRGQMLNPALRVTPHRLHVPSHIEVPGSKPAENMYDVVNALSYLSSHQESIQTGYDMMNDVPKLMQALTQ